MKAVTVAKKDFRDAVQSRALWTLVAVFVVLTVISAYAFIEAPELFGGPGDPTFEGLVFFIAAMAALFVPLAAIIVCYKSIAGERELGSIKVLLSLPARRRDVFFGKVLGRGAVITTALGVGIFIGMGVGALLLGSIDLGVALVFLLLTVVFALVYTVIMVSLSAVTASTVRATTYALGFFVVFELLWDIVPLGLLYVVEGFTLPAEVPNWLVTVTMVAPSNAYFSAINSVLPGTNGNGQEPGEEGVEVGMDYGDALLSQPEIGFVFLAFWLVVPLVAGYYRFDRADL